MRINHQVVVFDAADLEAESSFWAGVLSGIVDDVDWHMVIVDGASRVGVQLAPNHVPPEWPDGTPEQQIYLDLMMIRRSIHRGATIGGDGTRATDGTTGSTCTRTFRGRIPGSGPPGWSPPRSTWPRRTPRSRDRRPSFDPGVVPGVGDEEDRVHPVGAHLVRERAEAFERGVPDRDRDDRGGRDALTDQVVPARFGLGGAIARLVRAEHEHLARTALPEHQGGMVEPPPEDGRRDAVVLGCAEHGDRVSPLDVARVVVVGGPPDHQRGPAHDEQRGEEGERDRAEEGVPGDAAHRPSLATTASRSSGRSRATWVAGRRPPLAREAFGIAVRAVVEVVHERAQRVVPGVDHIVGAVGAFALDQGDMSLVAPPVDECVHVLGRRVGLRDRMELVLAAPDRCTPTSNRGRGRLSRGPRTGSQPPRPCGAPRP